MDRAPTGSVCTVPFLERGGPGDASDSNQPYSVIMPYFPPHIEVFYIYHVVAGGGQLAPPLCRAV